MSDADLHDAASGAIVAFTTAPDAATAEALARRLVDARVAACVQVVPGLRSVYRWQGDVAVDDEVQLVVKTTADRFDAVDALVREHHPYAVPELVAVPAVRGSADYLAWLRDATQPDAERST